MKRRFATLALLSGLILSARVLAASCTVNTVGVAFGSYDVFKKGATNSTGRIRLKCSSSLSYTIALSAGAGTMASRVMTHGADDLQYNLYTDSTRTTVWGDGTSGSVTMRGLGNQVAYTVYARIPARQNVPAGSYSDTVTVTVTY